MFYILYVVNYIIIKLRVFDEKFEFCYKIICATHKCKGNTKTVDNLIVKHNRFTSNNFTTIIIITKYAKQ